MPKEKLCPLSFNSPDQVDILSCVKEKCAWWSQVEKCCSIGLIGNALAGISRATK